jgi:hypothetical protein
MLRTKGHESGHFLLGQANFLPAKFGQREILHFERFAASGFRGCEGVMRFGSCRHLSLSS